MREVPVGVVPALGAVAQALVREVPVGVIIEPELVSVAPALVREVPVGVIIVPALCAVAPAQVREVAFFVSFRYRFHFFASVSLCIIFPNFKIGDCFKTSVSSTDFFDDAALWHLFDSLITIFAWYKFHFFIIVFSLLSIPS